MTGSLSTREHLVVGGDGPEALAVGGVRGGLVPPDRRQLPMQPEHAVREPAGEGVEIGEVDPPEVVDHRDILVGVPAWVKNGCAGGVAQLAEAGRLNRLQ